MNRKKGNDCFLTGNNFRKTGILNILQMKERILLNSKQMDMVLNRLCYQLIEQHEDFSDTVIIGIQKKGVRFAQRMHKLLSAILKKNDIPCGDLDITFYRDDFRKKELIESTTHIEFSIENKNVILIDDVLFTGRTVRSALDAMLAFGRPKDVELLVLIDRRLCRNLPIHAKYSGKIIDSAAKEKVEVHWKETEGKDEVVLLAEIN